MKKVLTAIAAAVLLTLMFFLLRPAATAPLAGPNTLSAAEQAAGWKLLFDGSSLDQWHTYGSKGTGPAWQVKEGSLLLYVPRRAGNNTPGGGNLVTNEVFQGDFEFKGEWKIENYTNSGIFFFVAEDTAYQEMYHSGLEFQVTDNAIYEGAEENNNKRAGDIFGISSALAKAARPVGEWNELHVIHRNDSMKVLLNQVLIHNISLSSPEWKEALRNSPLKDAPVGQGKFAGRIGLQDWGSQVWYRNLKIRGL